MKAKSLNLKSDFFLITGFLIFGLIPILSTVVEPTITILLLLSISIHSIKIKNQNSLKTNSVFILNGFLFFILLITIRDGFSLLVFKKLEQMSSMLIFPAVFFLLKRESNIKIRLVFDLWKKVFIFSTVLLVFISFFLAANYINPKYPDLDTNFFRHAILDSPYFSRDPIYISIYLNISILLCLDFIFKNKKRFYKIFFFFLILILSSLMFILSVKMAIIALVVSLIVFLILNVKTQKFLIIASITLIPIILFIFYGSHKINRFSELFDNNILNKNTQYNSTFVHKQTIICATKIFKSNFFFGVGIENTNSKINDCVRNIYKHNEGIIYNSHNQYLSYGVHSGILGFLLFLIVIFVGLNKSYKKSNILFTLLLYFSIVFLTENILERQSGLLLFVFLLNIVPCIEAKE